MHKNEKQECATKHAKYGCAAPAHKRRGSGGPGEIIASNINLVLSARAHKNEKQGGVTKQEMSGFAAPVDKRRG